MPARQWILAHLDHHKYTDHDEDPYNIQKGFWWAHFEWIVHDQPCYSELPQRLASNPVIRWQETYYWPICIVTNGVVPVAAAIASGSPWWGGLLLSALRMAIMENVIFAVNSVCHYWGTQPYDKGTSARDVAWFPFAMGEQYHNYHHTFPRDYRHGIRKLDFDPTKWFIELLQKMNLAHELVAVPERQVEAAKRRAEKI